MTISGFYEFHFRERRSGVSWSLFPNKSPSAVRNFAAGPLLLFNCTLTSQINYKYRIFSFVKFYMEPANQFVWVKYGAGHAVEVSVSSDCNVSRLIKVIKGELSDELMGIGLSQIELYKPEEDRKEGGEHKGGEETPYEPDVLVSAILRGGVEQTARNPILIRTTQQGIYD
jgi:hypothetical protein